MVLRSLLENYTKKDTVIKDDIRAKILTNIFVLVALFNIKEQFLPVGSKNKGPDVTLNVIENNSMNNDGMCRVRFFIEKYKHMINRMNHTNMRIWSLNDDTYPADEQVESKSSP